MTGRFVCGQAYGDPCRSREACPDRRCGHGSTSTHRRRSLPFPGTASSNDSLGDVALLGPTGVARVLRQRDRGRGGGPRERNCDVPHPQIRRSGVFPKDGLAVHRAPRVRRQARRSRRLAESCLAVARVLSGRRASVAPFVRAARGQSIPDRPARAGPLCQARAPACFRTPPRIARP